MGTAAVPLPPTSQPESTSGILLLLFTCWAVGGLVVAYLLGVFRRDSIRGPERLRHDETVWWLLMIPCCSILVVGRMVPALNLARFGLPKDALDLLTGDVVEFCVVILAVLLFQFVRIDSLRLMGLRFRQIPIALLGGLLAIFVSFPLVSLCSEVVTVIYERFHLKQADAHEVLQMIAGAHLHRIVIICVVTATVVAPLAEEFIFRGMIQTLLSQLFSVAFGSQWLPKTTAPVPGETSPPPGIGIRARWAAVVMTSIAFAAFHGRMEWFAPLFLLSVCFGYVYERTGNLWMTVVAHSMFNTTQILLFFVFQK